MSTAPNNTILGGIASKLFWGEALTTDDYTDILGYGQDVLNTFRGETGDLEETVLAPLQGLLDSLKPMLSDTAAFVAERALQILSAILGAINWLLKLIK